MLLNRKVFRLLCIFCIVLLMPQEQWGLKFTEELDDVVILSDAINATCPAGYFQCLSDPFCFLQRYYCDGRIDCKDYSDEDSCGVMIFHEDANNQGSGNQDVVPPQTCDSPFCVCKGFDIFCKYQNLTTIPTGLPRNYILILDLMGNNYAHIDDMFFDNLPNVDELILAYCGISFISPKAFRRFSDINIDVLQMSGNYIVSFNQTIFMKRCRLKTLNLGRNKIKVLHDYDFKNLERLVDLDLKYNNIETFDASVFAPLICLRNLDLRMNFLTHLDSKMFPVIKALFYLHLAHNRIDHIEENSFKFPRLDFLSLAGNRLIELEKSTFCGMKALRALDLSNNNLYRLKLHTFDCVAKLEALRLVGNKIRFLDKRVVQSLTNLHLITVRYQHICHSFPNVRRCTYEKMIAILESDLITSRTFRGIAWVTTCITLLGNLVMFVHQIHRNARSNAGYSLYLQHLALSGILMGIYVAIIVGGDVRLRGNYEEHDFTWRESGVCAFAGFLNSWSCLSSVLLITLGAWDRMMFAIKPRQARNSMRKRLFRQLLILWGVSFVLAATPLIPLEYFGTFYFGLNEFCLPLRITIPYAQGWLYSAILNVFINTLSLIFILFCYLRMCRARRDAAAGPRGTTTDQESARSRRFAIILGLDCVLWMPVICINLVALSTIYIGFYMYHWLAFVIIPSSAALNPILYVILTIIFRHRLRPVSQPSAVDIPLIERSNPRLEISSSRSTCFIEQPSTSKGHRKRQNTI